MYCQIYLDKGHTVFVESFFLKRTSSRVFEKIDACCLKLRGKGKNDGIPSFNDGPGGDGTWTTLGTSFPALLDS